MSLIDTMMTECTLLQRARESDGEGGFTVSWSDGETFLAAIVIDSSEVSRVAEQEGNKRRYTITTKQNVALDFHDVFRRESDGAIFRVTSMKGDTVSPKASTLNMAQVRAERWELE